ncbi:uncharacterized protein LOC103520572, partial [Diaphorina citri]|uniref:Uncharacterized protein LOC103520572 n=1 Tax=Diaphorina citri TaxID=121845 RepID=A0A3Q0JJW3_DIACI
MVWFTSFADICGHLSACLSTPIPYLPSIDLCILFYNIFTPGRNIHMCVNFLTRVEHAEVFVMEFDCFKIGVDGFMTYKPEENADPIQTTIDHQETFKYQTTSETPKDPIKTTNDRQDLQETFKYQTPEPSAPEEANAPEQYRQPSANSKPGRHLLRSTDKFIDTKKPQEPPKTPTKKPPSTKKPTKTPTKQPSSTNKPTKPPIKQPPSTEKTIKTPPKQPSTDKTTKKPSNIKRPRPQSPKKPTPLNNIASLQQIRSRGGIYFDPRTNLSVPLKGKFVDGRTTVSRYASLPCSCDRETVTCSCCVNFGLYLVDYHRSGCLTTKYDPYEFTFDMRMTWKNDSIFNYTVNAKNPPPACLSTPIPYLPSIDLCILFYNIFTPGRNIHMCVNFLTRVEHAEVFVMEFDCFKIGVDGFMTYKPEENAGISTEGPDEEEFTTDDYDEIIECTPGYSPDSTNETETTTLVECMTRPTTPVMENVTHVTQMDMITPASWSSGWCFYFWCSSNTTTTTPTPILNEEYPPTANSSMGSNGNSSWCWYFWCNSTNDVPPSAPPTNGSANGNG